MPDGKTRFEITIENPRGTEQGVTSATLDGAAVTVVDGAARVPAIADGKTHRVVVTL